ncbi:MAG TPA: N-acetyltransferase [Planctomycetaceae bacterium]|jgi:putative acetyltransferase|nr:N-acetyltransferase [Planctomycetaceae bacterium]
MAEPTPEWRVEILVRAETADDRQAVRTLISLAFGRDDEADLVEALRDGGYVRASLVAEVEQVVVAHILFSDLPIHDERDTVAALALAPLAVLPQYQRRGIGSHLTEAALDTCRTMGHRIVVVLGQPDFYRDFGFSSELARPLESPFSGKPSFMAAELIPGALKGVTGKAHYAPPFGIDY